MKLARTIILLLVGLLLVASPTLAQDGDAAGEVDPKKLKEERKAAAKQKKRMMQSCLTLVRAYYAIEEPTVSAFIEAHPTLDKNRLLSRTLAQMMIKCNQNIS